ncbi:MAG: PAS domain S-box protein, partial [Desulfobulbaceae bacterium]|nr:PAS domain S-box protein [Desulfobulbaceae bacterium]
MAKGNIGKIRSPLLTGAMLISWGWTLIVFFSLMGNLYQHNRETEAIVLNVARTHLEKDVLFRNWIVRHGGVYAPVTDETPPNPYIKPDDVSERDIVTPSGRVLTLINPAYMIRQLYQTTPFGNNLQHPVGKISSLNPVRPENISDSWEKEALLAFSEGEKEKSELIQVNGTKQMRLMQPIIAKPDCLSKCHPVADYKDGDVMGGISITVPMAPFDETTKNYTISILVAHLSLWFLVLLGIWFAYVGMNKRNIDRQQSEEALRRSEERFRSLIENALDIITVLDKDGLTIFESPSMHRVLGRKAPVMLNKSLVEMLHPDDRARVSEALDRLSARPGTAETFELRYMHGDGEWHVLEVVGQRLPANLAPAAFVINSRDITTRKQAEGNLLASQRQMRSLASRLSRAEEETRHTIATGLHEQIGQNLSVVKLKLGALAQSASSPEIGEQLRYLDELLAGILKETRTLTFELSPPILYDIGLEAALKWAAGQFQSRNKIACQFEDDGED